MAAGHYERADDTELYRFSGEFFHRTKPEMHNPWSPDPETETSRNKAVVLAGKKGTVLGRLTVGPIPAA